MAGAGGAHRPGDDAAHPHRQFGDRPGFPRDGAGQGGNRQICRQRPHLLSRRGAGFADRGAGGGLGAGARLGARGAGRSLRAGRGHHRGRPAGGEPGGGRRGASPARPAEARRAPRRHHAHRLGADRAGGAGRRADARRGVGGRPCRRGLADGAVGQGRDRALPPGRTLARHAGGGVDPPGAGAALPAVYSAASARWHTASIL